MPSTVYKGDLAEVSFAPETGMVIRIGTASSADTGLLIETNDNITTLAFRLEVNNVLFDTSTTIADATCVLTNSDATVSMTSTANIHVGMAVTGSNIPSGAYVASITSTTVFELSANATGGDGSATSTLTFTPHSLRYPKNMLVGSQLVWTTAGGTNVDDIVSDDLATNGRIFTIVENDKNVIKITPAMITANHATIGPGNILEILPYKTPPMDVSMKQTASFESVKTDQFLGIATALTLPETKVDLKRFHVVGLGRDVSVQVPGKLTNEGGSFEVAMHSARWLKYCLGNELILTTDHSSLDTTLSSATLAGQSSVVLTAKSDIAVTGGLPDVPYYLEIRGGNSSDDVTTPVVSDHEPDGGTWNGTLTDFEFDVAKTHEIRRVIGVSENDNTVYLDEPLTFPHASGTHVEIIKSGTDATEPVTISTTGTITHPVTRVLFSRSTQPSFALEVSQRRRDVDTADSTTDGGVGDAKELTRVFRGCKVTDFTMTTDNDAALRLSVNFNAALCYTDTGRLESTPITRYASHRMFDDTANTEVKRIESGIGKGTQKPFMFYNGSITLAGQQVAQVMNFSLTGQTGMQAFHTINGHYQSSSASTDQVPFAGARNANLMIEGQTSYEMTMEIAVDDPLFYHKMRTGTEFSVNGENNSTTNQIRIIFEKNKTGSTADGDTEKMVLLIDDYYIIEAPLQIPEDKGVVKSTLKIMPKAIKVLARDAVPKY